jgi:dCMP deaminase
MKRKVAAVVVQDKRIISTGYNGTPRGVRNCDEGGCPRCNAMTESDTKLDECLCSHAEENAITQAAYHGVSLKGSTIYTVFSPCLMCSKMIINSGIKEVVYGDIYAMGEVYLQLLAEAKVDVRSIHEPKEFRQRIQELREEVERALGVPPKEYPELILVETRTGLLTP